MPTLNFAKASCIFRTIASCSDSFKGGRACCSCTLAFLSFFFFISSNMLIPEVGAAFGGFLREGGPLGFALALPLKGGGPGTPKLICLGPPFPSVLSSSDASKVGGGGSPESGGGAIPCTHYISNRYRMAIKCSVKFIVSESYAAQRYDTVGTAGTFVALGGGGPGMLLWIIGGGPGVGAADFIAGGPGEVPTPVPGRAGGGFGGVFPFVIPLSNGGGGGAPFWFGGGSGAPPGGSGRFGVTVDGSFGAGPVGLGSCIDSGTFPGVSPICV
mmetsp:Transcript_22679/g.55205  ORF Transcript_22679/g.55205 Transcript_22679/m.55205 type:complete len:271 (-) Transcript_22679:748-1560(-)